MLAGTGTGAAAVDDDNDTTDGTAGREAAKLRGRSMADSEDEDDEEDEDEEEDDGEWMREGSFVWRGVVFSVGDCALVNGDVAYTAEINGKTRDVQDKTDIWVTKILAFQRAVSSFFFLCAQQLFRKSHDCVYTKTKKRKSQGVL